MSKEAQARIKINRLLEAAGWRFFDDGQGKANIALEPNIKLTQAQVDAMGNDFETSSQGFIDFLLLDVQGFPLVVLEAKAENKNPLIGKEQARKYARSQNCRFVILSNGNLHYLWDLNQGNPHIITRFPAPDSIKGYTRFQPDPARLVTEDVPLDYIARTQMPAYDQEVGWKNADERPAYIQKNRLRFLRAYQQRAALAIQTAVKEGKTRFLLEMATGTGKTLPEPAALVSAVPTTPEFVDQFSLPQAPERHETSGSAFDRSAFVREAVLKRANGTCEYCGEPGFKTTAGSIFLETHHVIALVDDGPDQEWNVVGICPTDHRRAHFGDDRAVIQEVLAEMLIERYPAAAAVLNSMSIACKSVAQ